MRFDDLTVRDLLDAIAAKTPTPGGGAVASIVAAVASALARMVVNYSLGKKSLAAHESANADALQQLAALGAKSLDLAEADALAYGRLNELWKLDKTDPRRVREFPAAVAAAIDAPREVLELSLSMLRMMQALTGTTNPMLKSDLAIAAVLAEAAAHAAAWNVRINLPLLESADEQQTWKTTLASALSDAASMCAAIEQSCGATG